jgi:hypothetical protein
MIHVCVLMAIKAMSAVRDHVNQIVKMADSAPMDSVPVLLHIRGIDVTLKGNCVAILLCASMETAMGRSVYVETITSLEKIAT